MKRFITFLTIMCLPAMAVGGALTSVVKYAENKKKNIETERNLDKVIDQKVVDALVKRLAQSFPDHAEELSKLIDEKQEDFERAGDYKYTANVYSGFVKFYILLSHKVFNEIKEREIERMKNYGELTGRKIIESGGFQWLDRGEYLESDACNFTGNECEGKDRTFECYSKLAQKYCSYPDGFEEYVMKIYNNVEENVYEISVSRDNKAENKHYDLSVQLKYGADIEYAADVGYEKGLADTDFEYSESSYDYLSGAKLRNNVQQAQRNGAFLYSSYCSWADTKADPKCKDIVKKKLADFYPNGDASSVPEHSFWKYRGRFEDTIKTNKQVGVKKY